MSKEDSRFEYPIEFVKQHVLGCFEASKACAILPGKPHLYHVEFLRREGALINEGSAIPLDFHLQSHFSPCEEVSWYLHMRENLPVFEGSVTVDEEYVIEHEVGDITITTEPQETVVEMWDERSYMVEVAKEHTARAIEILSQITVQTTPENSTESVTDTEDSYGRGKKWLKKRSRFDKINKDLSRS